MNSVWDEASTQTREMLSEFTKPTPSGQQNETNTVCEGLKRITLNVIGSVIFGIQRPWVETATTKPPPGFRTTAWSSLLTIMNYPYHTVFISTKIMTFSLMPKAVKEIGFSKIEFPLHLQENIVQERCNPSGSNSLLASLVRLPDQKTKISTSRSSKTSTFLTEEEIIGNLYNMTIAGFDTTANTLSYALMMLVINPEWQDWIIEETDEVSKLHPGAYYSVAFPHLTRLLALMVCRISYPILTALQLTFLV